MVWGIMDMLDTTATLMGMDIGEGKGGQLIQRLIPSVTEDSMEEAIVDIVDIVDTVDALEEKGDQQNLKQKPPLTPRLILTCCMEDIMELG